MSACQYYVRQGKSKLSRFSFESGKLKFRSLGARVVGRCNCGWEFTWLSGEMNSETGNLFINDLASFAEACSPVSIEHAIKYLRLLWLRPPVHNMYTFKKQTVAPVIKTMWHEEQAKLLMLAQTLRGMIYAYDACHTCVRRAELTTANCLDLRHKNKVVWFGVSKAGESATREATLCRVLMQWLQQHEVDLAAMCMDESSCRTIVGIVQREFALTEPEQLQMVQVMIDIWHGKKSGRKGFKKHVAACSGLLHAALRAMVTLACTEKRHLTINKIAEFLQGVRTSVVTEFDGDFKTFAESAKNLEAGHEDWAAACADDNLMDAMLTKLHAQHNNDENSARAPKQRADTTTETMAAITAEINELRALNNTSRQSKALAGTQIVARKELPHLLAFNLRSTPQPMKSELASIVSNLHVDYQDVTVADFNKRNGPHTRNVSALQALVAECLPSSLQIPLGENAATTLNKHLAARTATFVQSLPSATPEQVDAMLTGDTTVLGVKGLKLHEQVSYYLQFHSERDYNVM